MPFSFENFPYKEYADQIEDVDWDAVEAETGDIEASRNALYKKAINDFISDQDKKAGIDQYKATLEAEKHFSDARKILGLPDRRTKDEQFELIEPHSFQKYLLNNGLDERDRELPLSTYIDGYIDTIHGDKWANPELAAIKKKELKNRFVGRFGDVSDDDTVNDFLGGFSFIKQESEVQTANKADSTQAPATEDAGRDYLLDNPVYQAGQRFGEVIGPGLRRSWVNEDTQNAADRIANPITEERVSTIGPGPVNQIPSDRIRESIDIAAGDWVDSQERRQSIGEDPVLQKLFESEDINAALTNLFSDASTLPRILAENGIDILEEAGTQLGVTAVGSLASPAIGIAAGSVAGAAVARDNAYSAFFDQQIQKYIEENNLPMDKESVLQFYDDKEAYQAAKDDAELSANIIASGAFASSMVGGHLAIGTAAKIAARAGAKPTLKNGQVVFQRVTRGDVARRLTGAAAAATVIDTSADLGATAAVGDEITPAQVLVTPLVSATTSIADVGGGVIAGGGDVIGDRTTVKAGDVIYDEDGKGLVVTGGDGSTITAADETGSRTIEVEEIGSRYSSTRNPDAPTEITPQAIDQTPKAEFTSEQQSFDIDAGSGGYILDEIVTAIQNRDSDAPTLPDDMVATLNNELSRASGQRDVESPTSFNDLLDKVGDSVIWDTDGDIIKDDAHRVLVNGLKPLTYQDGRGVYRAVITPAMDQQQIQARTWAAEIVNYSNRRAGSDRIRKKALAAAIPSADPLGRQPVTDPRKQAIPLEDQRSREEKMASLVSRSDSIQQQIDEIDRQTEDAATRNDFTSAAKLNSIKLALSTEKRKVDADYLSFIDSSRLLPSKTLEEMEIDAVNAAKEQQLNEFRKIPSTEQALANLIQSRQALQSEIQLAIDSDDADLFVKLSDRAGRLDSEIYEAERYLGIKIDDIPSVPAINDVGDAVDVADGFQGNERIERLVGSYVDYNGIEGYIINKGDVLYVVSEDGDIPIESGLSGKTIDELGVTPLTIDFSKVYRDREVISDFSDNSVVIGGNLYSYKSTSYDSNSGTIVTLIDENGAELTLDGARAEEIETQKILHEIENSYGEEEQAGAIQKTESDKDVRDKNEKERDEPNRDTGKAKSDSRISAEEFLVRVKRNFGIESKGGVTATESTIAVRKKDGSAFATKSAATSAMKKAGVDGAVIKATDGGYIAVAKAGSPTGFTTAKGSTYTAYPDGTTKRVKAKRDDPGHEGDFGDKNRSARTVYVEESGIGLSPAQLVDPLKRKWRIIDHGDGTISRAELNQNGQWGISPSGRRVRYKTSPEIGLHPVELWNEKGEVFGEKEFSGKRFAPNSYAGIHVGNKITSIRADLISPVEQPIPEQPKPTPRPKINTTFVPVTPERTYNYGSEPANYIPPATIDRIRADGYEVEEVVSDTGGVSGLRVKVGNKNVSISSRGAANPEEIKDRSFSVRMKGRKLKSYGGNKRFTIPSELPPIIASDVPAEFIQSVNDAADAAGYRVQRSTDNSVRTITKDGKSHEIRNENGQIYVDGEPVGTHVGIKQEAITKEQAIKEHVEQKKAEIRAEHTLRNPAPRRETFAEKKNGELQARMDFLDEPIEVTPITETMSAADVGGSYRLEIGGDPDATIRQAKIDTTKAVVNTPGTGNTDYTIADIQPYVDRLPQHIREMITLWDTPDNLPRQHGTLGFFAPDYNGNGPQIHIDIFPREGRTLEGVISTLSEEVAHFSFDNWTTGDSLRHMKRFYDKAFRYYRAQIEGSLGIYIESYNIDMNKPTPYQQYVLVNELFSKQGTTFTDLIDNKASRPAGLTDEEIADLRKTGREAQDSFVFDMTDGGDNSDMKAFAKEILKAQSAGVVGKQTVFDMKVDKNGRTLRIIPTPIGQNRTVRPIDAEGDALRNRLDQSTSGPLAKFWKWRYQNAFSGNLLSTREIDRIISNASGLDHARNRKVLQRDFHIARRVEAILKANGVSEIKEDTLSGGVRNLFESLGIKGRGQLSVADEADGFISRGSDAIVRNAEDIRIEIGKQTELLRRWGEKEGVDPFQLGSMISELSLSAKKYRTDWIHRRYRAYEDPKERKVFEEMLDELNGKKNPKGSLWEQKQKAEAEIRKIKASNASKIEKQSRISEQERIASKYDRLIHLHKKFHFQSNRNKPFDNTQYVKEVKNYLRNLIDSNRSYQGGNFTKLNQISATRGRKLDHEAGENTSDFHEIQFLGLIENPVENIVFSLHQQKEVLRTLHANRTLAEELVDGVGGDIAYIRGSADITSRGSEVLGIGQEGSILKYVQVDPALAANLNEQIELQSQINESWMHAAVGTIKFGQTVLNPGTVAANYLGIASVAFGNGHMLYFNKMIKQPKAYREAWIQRSNEKDKATGESYAEKIIREMNELRVLGTGLQAGTLEITNRGTVFQKALQGLTTAIEKADTSRGITSRAAVDTIFEAIQDFYTFADDSPKILGYMIERDKAELKWKAKLNRENYDSDKDYRDALEAAVKREAADKTLRQNTDWGVAPNFAKRMAHNNQRYFVGDYIMHTMQMLKIAVENRRLLQEEIADWKEANAGGHTEWRDSLSRSITARAIGNGGIYGGLALTAYSGYSLIPLAINKAIEPLAEYFSEISDADSDDSDDLMDEEQRLGVSQLMMFSTWGGAVKYEPLAIKDGDWVYTVNSMRLNNYGVFTSMPTPSTEHEYLDQATNMLLNMFFGGEGGTNANQILDAARGIDWKGEQLDGPAYTENLLRTLSDKVTPGLIKEAYEGTYGESWLTGKNQGVDEWAMSNLGVSMKKVFVPEIATQMGYEISRKYRNRNLTSALVSDIEKGNKTISKADIVKRIEKDFAGNKKLMNRYNFFTQAWTRAGYTKSDAAKHMVFNQQKSKKTGFSAKNARKILNGNDIFTQNSLKKIRDLRDNLEGRPVTKKWPKEWRERAIENAEFAIEQYEKLLN